MSAPTAGSCGILPAVLIGMEKNFDIEEDAILKAMLIASGVGAVLLKMQQCQVQRAAVRQSAACCGNGISCGCVAAGRHG